jgi:hypothetical protein
VVRDTCRQIGEAYGKFANRLWGALAAIGVVAFPACWIAHRIVPGPPVFRWLQVGAVASIIAAASVWTIGFGTEERRVTRLKLRALAVRFG